MRAMKIGTACIWPSLFGWVWPCHCEGNVNAVQFPFKHGAATITSRDQARGTMHNSTAHQALSHAASDLQGLPGEDSAVRAQPVSSPYRSPTKEVRSLFLDTMYMKRAFETVPSQTRTKRVRSPSTLSKHTVTSLIVQTQDGPRACGVRQSSAGAAKTPRSHPVCFRPYPLRTKQARKFLRSPRQLSR